MILDYRDAVVDFARQNVAGLKDVRPWAMRFDLEQLNRAAIPVPCMMVAILGVPTMGLDNEGQFAATVQMSGYIVASDQPLVPAIDAAFDLAEKAAVALSEQTFGMNARPLMVRRIDNLHVPELQATGRSIVAVVWDQVLRFGRPMFDEDFDGYGLEIPKTLTEWPTNA